MALDSSLLSGSLLRTPAQRGLFRPVWEDIKTSRKYL
jgi:hypothetical protein